MKKTWMAELAAHYEKTRQLYPNDKLMIIFDIDGTIVDMRAMIRYVLHAFDRDHKTRFFRSLQLEDITVHENQIEPLLLELNISPKWREKIINWYLEHRWSSAAILESHQPFRGVIEVIRWFQTQPNTYVGVNTGRPEILRAETLRSLNKIGCSYRVHFTNNQLHMNPGTWEQDIMSSKVNGVRNFQKEGYRVFAMVDNEPSNLKAVGNIDPNQEILLLHADTIFESKRTRLSGHMARGKVYDLTELIPKKALPSHIQLVWHGINDETNLRQFLASEIRWGEFDVHMDPIGHDLILRHDTFTESPIAEDEEWLLFEPLLARLAETRKRIKIDFKAGGAIVDRVVELIAIHGFKDEDLWFNGNIEQLQEHRIRQLATAHPGSILQCPVDFLMPLIFSAPTKAKEILDMFTSWGINRFSINWQIHKMRQFFDQMDQWGFDVNIYNVPDLETFLQAVLLMPRSITSDFNFPKWYYYGRGSGEKGDHHEYSIRKSIRKQ